MANDRFLQEIAETMSDSNREDRCQMQTVSYSLFQLVVTAFRSIKHTEPKLFS